MFRHILHPTDFTTDSDIAFNHALALAVAEQSELSIVHTGQGCALGQEWAVFPRVRETLIRWGRLDDGAAKDAVGGLGLEVHKRDLDARDPGRALEVFARRNDCDLIVLATHGRQGVARWTRPSKAEALARATGRAAGTPTLFLPEGAPGFINDVNGASRLRNILLPFDGAPAPYRAIELARDLAAKLGAPDATFHLLHVGPGGPPPPVELLSRLSVQVHTVEGSVADAIVAQAQKVDADLIVMPTRGHDGFLDALRGSTTEQVLRQAGRALLAAPSE